jgi:hypothetical protein
MRLCQNCPNDIHLLEIAAVFNGFFVLFLFLLHMAFIFPSFFSLLDGRK